MSTGRLTRQELGWLLAQEARSAAKVLRQDVTLLRQSSIPPAPPTLPTPTVRVESTLDALDDAIDRLSDLQAGTSGVARSSRKGRIDVAALLNELAPTASISIEPGAGTEVFGDEAELRRLLHVLISQTNFAPGKADHSATPVRVRRETDWIHLTVDLGPDVSASTEVERRWLHRMATRMGGRLELEGGTMGVALPANAEEGRTEITDLKKELEHAQRIGATYARELVAAYASSVPESVARPEEQDVSARRFELLTSVAAAVHALLTPVFRGLAGEGERLSGAEILSELGRIADCARRGATERIDLAVALQGAVSHSEPRARRHDVTIELATTGPLAVSTESRPLSLLLRCLLDHAIAATPKGGTVRVTAEADALSAIVRVVDGGPVVPESARADLLEQRIDPTSVGRPAGIALLTATVAAASIDASLALRESPGKTSMVEVRFP